MVKTSLDLSQKSMAIFGNLQKCSENFWKYSCVLLTTFGEYSEYVYVTNKIIHYMVTWRNGISLLMFNSMSHSFVALTHEISI